MFVSSERITILKEVQINPLQTPKTRYICLFRLTYKSRFSRKINDIRYNHAPHEYLNAAFFSSISRDCVEFFRGNRGNSQKEASNQFMKSKKKVSSESYMM